MTQRAREFVDYWIAEFLHPDAYEDDTLCESIEHAVECLRSAADLGIGSIDIEEEFGDLVTHIARIHEQIVDAELGHIVRLDA
jgi:hypothetical protein